jgi:hypothetical protein
VTAHFRHEAPTRTQGAPHTSDYRVWIAHPVERGVAEDGIELAVEIELFPIHHACFHA